MDIAIFNSMYKVKPIKFYPYPHAIINSIVRLSDRTIYAESNHQLERLYHELQDKFIELFTSNGITCHSDNKIVFEVEFENVHFYIGFYDWVITIGLGVIDVV